MAKLEPTTKVITLDEVAVVMETYGVKPPDDIHFPCTFKLNEKWHLHFERRSYQFHESAYREVFSFVVNKNNVRLLEGEA